MDACPCKVAEIRFLVKCAPKKAPCPTCGKLGVRKRKPLHRSVRSIAYRAVVYLDITYAEYRATCRCCKTFRNNPAGVLPKSHYDNKVREAVLNRILHDAMSIEAVLRAMSRDIFLDLSTGFVYDCLEQEVRRLSLADCRAWSTGAATTARHREPCASWLPLH